jgi:UDP-N-acetyl-D-mannosaminuronic acid dehydrogenase
MSEQKVAVVGLGKIGLPLAVRYALSGMRVTGCDISQERVDEINAGHNPIAGEAGMDEAVASCVADGSLRATTETSIAVKDADVTVIVVPLIALGGGRLDFRHLDAANDAVAAGLHPGMLLLYETTLPVGTTRRFASELAARAGLALGTDLFAAFSPERVYSGRILRDLEAYPKIVGGVDEPSGSRASEFYRQALPGVPIEEVPDAETAELVKLAETTYRDVNIAFANELARYAAQRGIDVDPVIRLANSQPFSHIHQPGAGVGGHCIPHYPQFILADAAEAPLIRLSREINDHQPAWVVQQLEDAAGGLKGRTVLILGVSYRENVRELTSSPGVDLIKLLAAEGALVSANDPYFSDEEIRALGADPTGLDQLGEFDVVLLQAAHDEYGGIDWSTLRPGAVVFDGRNALDPAAIVDAGAAYRGVGRKARGPR